MESPLGVKYDLVLALRSHIFEHLREAFYRYAFWVPAIGKICLLSPCNRLVQKKNEKMLFCCISFELSCCYYSLRRWGGVPLAWYKSRGTGRCFSSPIVLPESGSSPPQPTGRDTNTRSLWRPRPPMVANHWQPKPLTLPILLVGPESLPISHKQ